MRESSDPVREAAQRELCQLLDAELCRLPESQRAALVLCYLEGRTRDEAARQLGQSVRTLDRRLQRGRELLRRRLAQRGVTLSAALLGMGLTQNIAGASVPASLGALTARAAAGMMAGQGMAGHEVSAQVIALMKGVLWNMLQTRIKIAAISLLVLAVSGAGTGIVAFRASAQNSAAQSPPAPARADASAPAKPVPKPDVYALIRIEDSEPQLLPDARHPNHTQSDPAAYRRTQATLLLSRPVLHSALKRNEVKGLAILKEKTESMRWFERNIEVTFPDNTALLRVSFGEGSPEERAILINAVVDAYMDEVVYTEQRERQNRLTKLETAFNASKAELKSKQETIGRLSEMRERIISSFRGKSDREELAQLRKELLRVRLEKVGTQTRLNHRKSAAGGNDKTALAKLEEEIAVLTAQEKLLEKALSSLKEQAERVAVAEASEKESLRWLREQIETEKQFVDKLAIQLRTCQVNLLAPQRIHVVQKAEAPRKREK